MAQIVQVYIVTASIVAYIVAACFFIAYMVTAYVVIAHEVTAYIATAYIGPTYTAKTITMAHLVTACIGMAYMASLRCRGICVAEASLVVSPETSALQFVLLVAYATAFSSGHNAAATARLRCGFVGTWSVSGVEGGKTGAVGRSECCQREARFSTSVVQRRCQPNKPAVNKIVSTKFGFAKRRLVIRGIEPRGAAKGELCPVG